MGFDALLGNDQLKKNLTSALSRGRIGFRQADSCETPGGRHFMPGER